jgi:acyl carrier protein
MTDQVDAKLQQIVRATLDLPPEVDVMSAQQPAIESWDSLAHVTLMLAIESEFAISIDVADQIHLTSYRAISRYLEERGFSGAFP